MSRRTAAVLAAALALSAPGSALAQSAGDDQYRDPFAGENEPRDDAPAGGDTGGDSTPAPAPATPQPPAGATPAEPTATTAGTLPRTGPAAGWVAAAGLLLIVAGAALRRPVRA